MELSPPPAPAVRFAALIAALCAAVAASLVRPGKPGLAGPLILLLWTRLKRMATRVERLAARVAAGPLPPPRAHPAGAARRRPAASPYERLPRKRSWLVQLVPATAFGAERLRLLLEDAATQELIAAAPQLGRTLRPLCRALGLAPPPVLQRKPPAPAALSAPLAEQPPRRRATAPRTLATAPAPPPPTPRAPEVACPAGGRPVPA